MVFSRCAGSGWLLFILMVLFPLHALRAQIGGLDAGFNAGAILNGAAPGVVKALVVQSDGKTIIAGDFTSIGGTPRGRVARLNVDGSLDTTFAAGTGADGVINAVAVQNDGKVVIGGDFLNVDGVSRPRIARLSTTGALDATFNPGAGANGVVNAVAMNGSTIHLAGDFTMIGITARNRVAALTSTGSVSSFNVGSGPNGAVHAMAVSTGGGTIYLGGAFTTFSGPARNRLAAVSGFSGALTSFNSTGGPDGTVSAILIDDSFSSGAMLVAGEFLTVSGLPRARLARYSLGFSGDSLDASFNVWVNAPVRCLASFSVGGGLTRFLIGGEFTLINGQPRNRIARIASFSAGSGSSSGSYWDLDLAYANDGGVDGPVLTARVSVEGKAIIGGQFSNVGGTATPPVARLYSDAGSLPPAPPNSLTATAASSSQVIVSFFASANASSYTIERSPDGSSGWIPVALQSSTRFIDTGLNAATTSFYRVKASNSNGDSLPAAAVSATTAATEWMGAGALDPAGAAGAGANGVVHTVAIQADGSTLLAGNFTTVHGIARKNIARLLPDWTVDPSFDPGVGPDSTVNGLAVQPDGAIVIVGAFSNVAGVARKYLARLTATGALDAAFFNPGTGPGSSVARVALQADGRVLIGGSFSTVNGATHPRIARFEANGTLDSTFHAAPSSTVESIAVQRDGRILLGGTFSAVNGFDVRYAARLLPDGQLDFSFVPPNNLSFVESVSALNNGKVLLGGWFTTTFGTHRNRVERLNADGSLDLAFDPGVGPNTIVDHVVPQADGKVIIAGSFETVAGVLRPRIARLNADGTLDATFQPGAGAFSTINALAVGEDTRLVVGGSFTSFGIGTAGRIVRLLGDGHSAPPPVPTGLVVSAASASSLLVAWNDLPAEQGWKLERSPDGVSGWISVATPPWDVTSVTDAELAPATTYHFRLRSGNSAGDSEYSAVASGQTFSLFAQWKLDQGIALGLADDNDDDTDGIPLLVEYGLGLDPKLTSMAGLPTYQVIEGVLALSYRKFRSDVFYSVEASTDFEVWSALGVNQGSGAFPIAWKETGGAPQLFLRLRVERAP